MSDILTAVLFVCTVVMIIIIASQMKRYEIARWKSIPVALVLLLTGIYGSYVWYYIENFSFGGRSFYGAVFFVPVSFLPLSKLLRISYADTLDFAAPAGCITLAMVKLLCIKDRCCRGKILYVNSEGFYVRFPSEIVEMLVFLLISAILMYMVYGRHERGKVFLWFLCFYGASRFVLDFYREHTGTYALGLSAGSFWSLIAFIIGIGALIYLHRNVIRTWINTKCRKNGE